MSRSLAMSFHRSSYTARFAQGFQRAWEDCFDTPLALIDFATPFLNSSASYSVKPGSKSALQWDREDLRIVYAYHPQANSAGPTDPFQHQAMACAYSAALVAGDCPNPPLVGVWGLHLSFLHARRLLLACGFKVATVRTADSVAASGPRQKALQTFLLANLEADAHRSRPGLLEFPELRPGWQSDIIHSYLVKERVFAFDRDHRPVDPGFSPASYLKLGRLTGSQVLELVEYAPQKGPRQVLGIHPCLTRYPRPVLEVLRSHIRRLS